MQLQALSWSRGSNNVRHDVGDKDSNPGLVDGLKLIMEDRTSNLGWRIAAGCVLEEQELASLVKATNQPSAQHVVELIPTDKRKHISRLVGICRRIQSGKPVKTEEVEVVLGACGCDLQEILLGHVSEALSAADGTRGGEPGVRGIPITATTVQSSKGLAADYVFITHCDDQYMVKDKDKSKISDRDVCNFLVALTRARKRVYLAARTRRRSRSSCNG